MQHKNKVFSAMLAAVLALSLCTAGVTADPGANEVFDTPLLATGNTVRTMYGFEGTTDNTFNLTTYGTPSTGYSYTLTEADTEGISGEGISGQVLKLTGSNDAAKSMVRVNNYSQPGGKDNWNGAVGYEVYVDASAAQEGVNFLPGLMGTNYDSSESGRWCTLMPGSTVYVRVDGGDWQAKTVGDDWHIALDAGFKGWVRMGLTDGCLAGSFSTNASSVTDSLWYVRILTFSTKGTDTSIYIDSVRTVYADTLVPTTNAIDFDGTFDVRVQSSSQVTAAQALAEDEGIAGEGIAGSVLKLTAPADYALTNKSCTNVHNFSQINKNWTRAMAYEMYVDASKATDADDGVQFATGLMCNAVKGNTSIWANLLPGAMLQIRTDDGEWQNVTVAADRTITLPAGFAGWVRIPLEKTSFAGGPWANTDTPTNVPGGQGNVSQLTFEIAGTVNPVYVDSVRPVYGGFAGDCNGDGKLTTTDARQLLRAVVGKTTMSLYESAVADLSGDGRITTQDARIALRRAVGKA